MSRDIAELDPRARLSDQQARRALMAQKRHFGFNAAFGREPAKGAGACHPMTGNKERNWIGPTGLPGPLR